MIKVWILIFYISGYQTGGPAVIDNIATSSECTRLSRVFDAMPHSRSYGCISVWKIKQ